MSNEEIQNELNLLTSGVYARRHDVASTTDAELLLLDRIYECLQLAFELAMQLPKGK